MPVLGSESLRQLSTCDPRLQQLAKEAIKYYDFSVIEGHRNKEDQNKAYARGASKLPWPLGNHNALPSRAMDLAPYPVDWKEGEKPHLRFAMLVGVILVCAKQLGIKIRFGIDWNRNLDPRDETFLDYGHVELDD